jgi:hypothetical protein
MSGSCKLTIGIGTFSEITKCDNLSSALTCIAKIIDKVDVDSHKDEIIDSIGMYIPKLRELAQCSRLPQISGIECKFSYPPSVRELVSDPHNLIQTDQLHESLSLVSTIDHV